MRLNREQEDALLRFDPRLPGMFLIPGRPAANLLQQLKYRKLCRRERVPLRSWYRWELTYEGERFLAELRAQRGLPKYPMEQGGNSDQPLKERK